MSCPVGYTLFTGSSKCYKFVDKEVSIKEAYMACKKEGAVLASVHNAATNNHLSSFTSSRIWLGGHNPTSPSDPTTWTWNLSDGSAWGSYESSTPWATGQPDTYANEFFLETNFNGVGGGAGKWNNVYNVHSGGVIRKNTFICQKNPKKVGG